MDIPMSNYSPLWPEWYTIIEGQLAADISSAGLTYASIIHIGSTAVPGLNAKPWIDILITIPANIFSDEDQNLPLYVEALMCGTQQGGYRYIGNGGLQDRWSFKLGIRNDRDGNPVIPQRCVYIVPDGGVHHRSSLAFRETLRDDANIDLREEYGNLKWDLVCRDDFNDIWQYAELKNEVVRKVLRRAGWSEDEILVKEAMRVKNWPEELIV